MRKNSVAIFPIILLLALAGLVGCVIYQNQPPPEAGKPMPQSETRPAAPSPPAANATPAPEVTPAGQTTIIVPQEEVPEGFQKGRTDLPRNASKSLGASFMYRCWFEGAEFFYPVWSNGREELNQQERKSHIVEIARSSGKGRGGRQTAEWEAKKSFWAEYQPAGYRKMPNWEKVHQRKKDLRVETCGFKFVDVDGFGWNDVERRKGQYDWTIGDFMLDLNQKVFRGKPFVRIEMPPEWAQFEKNPNGQYGFYDPQNKVLMDHWESYCGALAERYDGDGSQDAPGSPVIQHFMLVNEPEWFWFNVDFDNAGWPMERDNVSATSWWQDAEAQGQSGAKAFAQKYGEMIFQTTKRAAEAIHKANPEARVGTPQFASVMPMDKDLFRYLLDHGLGQYVDAWGVHPSNSTEMHSLWQGNPEVWWWLEDATNQAPPFKPEDLTRVKGALDRKGQTLNTARPVDQLRQEYPYSGKMWRKLIDEPFSQRLEDLNQLFAEYDTSMPIWVTEELTIGPLATNRRENLMAALREYAIVFHENVEITVLAGYISATTKAGNAPVSCLPDEIGQDIIRTVGEAIGGAVPVQKFDSRWFVRGEDRHLDYRWTVYKLFNRGNEDILALWSNSGKDEVLDLTLNSSANIKKVRLIKYDADKQNFKEISELQAVPPSITVKPLKEFYFLSVTSDQPRFGWLKDLRRRSAGEEPEVLALYENTLAGVERAKATLKSRGRAGGTDKYRQIPRALAEAEDALVMGNYTRSREILDKINSALEKL